MGINEGGMVNGAMSRKVEITLNSAVSLVQTLQPLLFIPCYKSGGGWSGKCSETGEVTMSLYCMKNSNHRHLLITCALAQLNQRLMNTISITKALKWQLKSHTNYKWSTDGILFNCQTGRIIKKTINGGSIGYWIKGKWYSLKALKYEVEIIKEIECPF